MVDPARYNRRHALRFLKKRFNHQCALPLTTPLMHRFKMWQRGYKLASYTLYDLEQHASDYLSDIAQINAQFINGTFARTVLNDKLLFFKLLSSTLNVAPVIALIERGDIYTEGQSKTLLDLISAYDSLVLKPSGGKQGKGIYRLENTPTRGLQLNFRPVSSQAVQELVTSLDDYLVTHTIRNSDYAQTIYPQATNTLRVMTFIDPQDQKPFIGHAFHRFGAVTSSPTDNWSRGGLAAPIDLATGILSGGLKDPKRTAGKVVWYNYHPDSGEPIRGVQVPRWSEVCKGLLETVRTFPFLIYVGWDVVITQDGFCILEGNNSPYPLQLEGGILTDDRVRRFYEYHQVI